MTVAMTEATRATSRVFPSEDLIVSLVNSLLYQSRVKPVHTVRLFDALKLLTMRTAIGM